MNKLYRIKGTNRYWDEKLPWHWKVLKAFGLIEENVMFEVRFDVESEDIII